jgi:hypothetical protein
MKNYLILVLAFLLLGCGAGGSSDTPRDINQSDSAPIVESNFRDVMLEWQPNTETNLAGYKVFMREDGKDYDYTNPEWETVDTDCEFYNLYKNTTYHFVVRAFSIEAEESGDSNEATLNSK